jgi:Tfp pilus assembly protein PilE
MARTDRINLSTRPFYNDRAVQAVLGLAAVAVLAFTAFNLWEVYVLSGRQAEVQARLARAESQTRQLREQAVAVRRAINPKELEATVAAAREANLLIERRVFSWTEVLNQFETTLPPTVRISSVRPRIERDGTMRVEVVVLARTVEAVDTFIENLEKRGAFSGVLSREEFVNEDGLIQASLEGRYRAAAGAAAAAKEGRP